MRQESGKSLFLQSAIANRIKVEEEEEYLLKTLSQTRVGKQRQVLKALTRNERGSTLNRGLRL